MTTDQAKPHETLKTDHRNVRARRVVTGISEDGRSTFVSDEFTEHRFVGDAYSVNMIWQVASLPVPMNAENTIRDVSFSPPANGWTFVLATFPPDSSWDYEGGYTKSLNDWGANHEPDSADAPGMHTTNSIDITTVISGEIWAILETGETLLKQGDTLIQRGTKHAWRNRSDRDCIVVAALAAATR